MESQQEAIDKHRLDAITLFALNKNFQAVAAELAVSPETVGFSADCVGDSLRKGAILLEGQKQPITNLAHMVRVAYMMKTFFPDDTYGRILALIHDAKEEALPDKLNQYKEADSLLQTPGLKDDIDMLTEEEPTQEEIDAVAAVVPNEFDALYIAKYRNYIKRLHENWEKLGNMELCDRFDGAEFDYLKVPKYKDRLKYKALESFGRMYATIAVSEHPITEKIRERCREQMRQFEVNEQEVEKVAAYYL